MNHRLSVIMVTLNAEELLSRSLESAATIADEIIVVDAGSIDTTLKLLKEFKTKVFRTTSNHLGRNKAKALSLAKGELVMSIDSDEILSSQLIRTIKLLKQKRKIADGYIIPFNNYFLGKRIKYGGENYSMLRLGKRSKLKIKQTSVHESLEIESKKVVNLNSPILHFSYRSLTQMYKKFTAYALWEAKDKFKSGERSSLKKIILYPIHMFWARFIKDEGYKDGYFRIPLDLGFAYMEFLTYASLAIKNKTL